MLKASSVMGRAIGTDHRYHEKGWTYWDSGLGKRNEYEK
jgi:hypothetical protein